LSALEIYDENGFKFFLCRPDKSPDIPNGKYIDGKWKGDSWQDPKYRLTLEQAEEFQSIGRMIGAWIPENIVVIDLDRHEGKPDGVLTFKEIKEKHGISFDMMDSTFVVRTSGNGIHIFFTTDTEYRQNEKAPGIDLKTHKGYVIAAGSPGYTAENNYDITELTEELHLWLESCEKKKNDKSAKNEGGGSTDNHGGEIIERKLLPVKTLKSLLSKVDATHFSDNGRWIEFVMSIKATCGDTEEVKEAIKEWSQTDPEYDGKERQTDTRIDSTEAAGGITIGTFIMFLREEEISAYLINQVVKLDSISNTLADAEAKENSLPFQEPDYNTLAETQEAIEFFHVQGNTSAASVMALAVEGNVIFVEGEKRNYFFNGSRWDRLQDIYQMIYTVMFRVVKLVYAKSEPCKESNDRLMKSIQSINSQKWKKSTLDEMNLRTGIFNEYVDWDSPVIRESVTTQDGVIDFSGGKIEKRLGMPTEYRRTFIDYKIDDVIKSGEPESFKGFLKSIFPDEETQETAIYSIALCISGNANKRHFQIWEGNGSNGKSTLIEILIDVIGVKAMTYSAELLLTKKFESTGNTPELAAFQGKYAAFGVETDAGKKFSTALIKNLTGGDVVAATPKYKAPVEFKSTWQLILAVNDMPDFSADDKAFINRLLVLPFVMKFYKNELEKIELLKAGADEKYMRRIIERDNINKEIMKEKPAIINFMIHKYVELQTVLKGDIPESRQCKNKKSIYIKDNDDIGIFLNDMCVIEVEKDYFSPTEEIADAYRDFVGNKKLSTKGILRMINKHDQRIEKATKRIDVQEQNGSYRKKQVRGLANIVLREKFEDGFDFDEDGSGSGSGHWSDDQGGGLDGGDQGMEIPFD